MAAVGGRRAAWVIAQGTPQLSHGFLLVLTQVLVSAILGLLLTYGLARLMRVQEMEIAAGMMRRVVGRMLPGGRRVNAVAIVPARDEADTVAATVAAIRALPGVAAVLVVDDASSDATAEAAERAGAVVLRLPRSAGKGAALEAGLEASRDAEAVLLLDADLGAGARRGRARCSRPSLAGEADMTVAVLPRPAGSGGFGLVKGLARAGIAPPRRRVRRDRAALRTARAHASGGRGGAPARLRVTARRS